MNDEPKLLAGRYEVGDLIGRGGMAEVHIGYDTRLGRTVAIKILRADLARDPSFQTRFRREAQSAAGLNHPTIVAVYDTGEDTVVGANGNPQAVPFIVMEYVEGHTVRDILKGDVAAPIDEAVEIVVGVLTALDYSHHAGLVHRDIKPANVMLTPTGAVKVMDFGIARALADAGQTMTQAQAVVGTAQYLSPEQARGENVDARSDLYSTGCLLFELLTGRPPFIGDSPVSVAYQHVREEAPKPSMFAADVPHALDLVVARSLAKSRDARYPSAQAFLNDLRSVMAGGAIDPATGALGVGAAALGAGAASAPMTPEQISDLPTQVMSSIEEPATSSTEVLPAGAGGATGWAAVGPTSPSTVTPGGGLAVAEDDDLIADDEAARRKRQWLILGGSAVAAILLIIALFAISGGGGEEEPETVAVPNVVGMTEEAAREALEEVNLVPEVVTEASEDVPVDQVIRTDPEAEELIAQGETVQVFVSAGADVVKVPSVRGLSQEDAVERIEQEGLRVESFDIENSPDFDEGRATRTDPEEGREVPRDSGVILYVATGQVDLPDLRGMSESEALATLAELKLTATVTDVPTDNSRPGEVIGQSPGQGLVSRGSSVTIEVATEPETESVPDVRGMTERDARNTLEDAGFSVRTESAESDSVAAGRVISQDPAQGSEQDPGTRITIIISTGPPDPEPEPEPEPDPTPTA